MFYNPKTQVTWNENSQDFSTKVSLQAIFLLNLSKESLIVHLRIKHQTSLIFYYHNNIMQSTIKTIFDDIIYIHISHINITILTGYTGVRYQNKNKSLSRRSWLKFKPHGVWRLKFLTPLQSLSDIPIKFLPNPFTAWTNVGNKIMILLPHSVLTFYKLDQTRQKD